MTLQEFAIMTGSEMVIRSRFGSMAPNEQRWYASIEDAETKDSQESVILTGTHGDGTSPYHAMRSYVEKIRGKWLVLGASGYRRREFGVPMTLGVEE